MPDSTTQPAPRPTPPRMCTSCGGQRGHTDTTPKPGGGHVSVWRRCQGCAGTGVRRGGV